MVIRRTAYIGIDTRQANAAFFILCFAITAFYYRIYHYYGIGFSLFSCPLGVDYEHAQSAANLIGSQANSITLIHGVAKVTDKILQLSIIQAAFRQFLA
jgi:hypothetical protein